MALPAGLPNWMYGIDNIQQRIGQAADEGGIDLGGNKIGQQLQALNDGVIVGAGYFNHGGPYFMTSPAGSNSGYGVVTIRMDTPAGPQDLYYQHINIDPSIKLSATGGSGQRVKKGQVIGTAGVGNPPQNILEMGVNVPWGGIWGTNHPGQWVDPEAIIRALMANYGSSTTSFTAPSGSMFDFGNLANTVATHVHLAPDATVATVFVAADTALQINNPFVLTTEPTVNVGPVTIPDPIGYIEEVAINLINDASALIVRSACILFALIILYFLAQTIFLSATDKALEPVGGISGAAGLATKLGMFA